MKLRLGVVEWEDASSVRCTADAWQCAEASRQKVLQCCGLEKAYPVVGVMIARKYLLNGKGSYNGCDQVVSLTPHRASDLSDTSVLLAR